MKTKLNAPFHLKRLAQEFADAGVSIDSVVGNALPDKDGVCASGEVRYGNAVNPADVDGVIAAHDSAKKASTPILDKLNTGTASNAEIQQAIAALVKASSVVI